MSSTVTEALLNAARDIGDSKGDKGRKAALSALSKTASHLAGLLPVGEAYPEVKAAIQTVQGLSELSAKLDQMSEALKRAPSATTEAVDAQKVLDRARRNVDAMLPPLQSTVTTMQALVEAAMEMEATYAELSKQMKMVDETLSSEKERLTSVANAVNNAAKLA